MQPLIIAGMHRSGTSVLTTILSDLGLFVGRQVDENHEATLFVELNNWLLRQAGAAWDYPEPFDSFLRHPELVQARAGQLAQMLKMPRAVKYLGAADFLRLGDIAKLDRPWGWKDPRNTFTVPVWQHVFPKAKLLVIHRHGADVAASLQARALRVAGKLARNPRRMNRWTWRLPVSANSFSRCLDLEQSLELWETYSEAANEHVARLGAQALSIRYEDILEDPVGVTRRIVDFAELEANKCAIERAVTRLTRDKAFKYREKPEAAALAERFKSRLAAFGY